MRPCWTSTTVSGGRSACGRALVDAARASFSIGQPYLVVAEFTSWRETAAAIAAGLGSEAVEWLDPDDALAVSTVSHRSF